jgi:hypothetical protein
MAVHVEAEAVAADRIAVAAPAVVEAVGADRRAAIIRSAPVDLTATVAAASVAVPSSRAADHAVADPPPADHAVADRLPVDRAARDLLPVAVPRIRSPIAAIPVAVAARRHPAARAMVPADRVP